KRLKDELDELDVFEVEVVVAFRNPLRDSAPGKLRVPEKLRQVVRVVVGAALAGAEVQVERRDVPVGFRALDVPVRVHLQRRHPVGCFRNRNASGLQLSEHVDVELVPAEAAPPLRALEAPLRTEVRFRITGEGVDSADRVRWRTEHPRTGLFEGVGRLEPLEVVEVRDAAQLVVVEVPLDTAEIPTGAFERDGLDVARAELGELAGQHERAWRPGLDERQRVDGTGEPPGLEVDSPVDTPD